MEKKKLSAVSSLKKIPEGRLSQHLTTPHEELVKEGITPVPLLGSTALETLISAYESSDKSYESKVEAAYAVAGLVRRTLRFTSDTPLRPLLNSENIAKDGYTNCHGYSVVASECLSALDLSHKVGFANGHSFILMEDDNWSTVNLIDTPVRPLCVGISGSISSIEQEEKGGAAWLHSDVILDRSDFQDKHAALKERQWMSFDSSIDPRITYKTEEAARMSNRLLLRFFEPSLGRDVIQNYSNFVHYTSLPSTKKNTYAAHDILQGVGSEYPEIDRRNKLYHPTKLISRLGKLAVDRELLEKQDPLDMALIDIHHIKESLRFSSDLTLQLWPFDQKRYLGKRLGSKILLGMAKSGYEKIYENRRVNGQSFKDVVARLKKV